MTRRFIVLGLALILAAPIAFALSLPHEPAFPADPLPGPGSTDPAEVGQWLAPFDGQVPAISMVLLKDGRVLYWGGVEARDQDQVFFFGAPHHADVGIIGTDYASGVEVPTPEGMGDIFCAGQTILADGRVLMAGGSEWKMLGEDMTGFVDGEKDTWTFDPDGDQWVREADMGWQRWYPTVMTRSDGSAMAASGIEHLPQPQTLLPTLESFDGTAWTHLEGSDQTLPMYPRLFTIPSGEMKGDIFYATVGTLWGPFGEHPMEATWGLQRVLDNETGAWETLGPSVFGARQHANAVMLPLSDDDGYTARILTFGGSLGRTLAATGLAEMTTLAQDGSVQNEIVDPLDHPRWHSNGVLLPDSTVLAVGGGMWDNVYAHGQRSSEVLVAEQFDPETAEWAQRAPMTVGRTYHSTAILLPNGKVLVGGNVPLPVPWTAVRDNVPYQSQIAETRFEVYEPPYLHWGVDRPELSSVPDHVGFGEIFQVGTPDAARVRDALLVRPGATTHAWDVSQRAVVLDVLDRSEGRLTFQAPPDGDVATPGPWMLFLRVDSPNGIVPGDARFVTVG